MRTFNRLTSAMLPCGRRAQLLTPLHQSVTTFPQSPASLPSSNRPSGELWCSILVRQRQLVVWGSEKPFKPPTVVDFSPVKSYLAYEHQRPWRSSLRKSRNKRFFCKFSIGFAPCEFALRSFQTFHQNMTFWTSKWQFGGRLSNGTVLSRTTKEFQLFQENKVRPYRRTYGLAPLQFLCEKK